MLLSVVQTIFLFQYEYLKKIMNLINTVNKRII